MKITKSLLTLAFMLLAGYLQAQNFTWAQKFYQAPGGSGVNEFGSVVNSVDADASGNAYVVGTYGMLAQGSSCSNPLAYEGRDGFIAKLNTNGTVLWEHRIGGLGVDDIHDVAVDGNGNAYITGYYSCRAVFSSQDNNNDTTALVSSPQAFIAKYDTNGNLQWVTPLTYTEGLSLYALSANDTHVFVSGIFTGTATFGSTTLSSARGMFVAKFDNSGTAIWANKADGSRLAPYGMEIDGSGNVYLTGDIASPLEDTATVSVDFGGTAGLVSGHIFLVKYTGAGTAAWAHGTVGVARSEDVGIDSNGNIYITGAFADELAFAGIAPLVNNSIEDDIFIAKFSSTGVPLWAIQAGGNGRDYGCSIEVDAAGNSYILGHYEGSATIAGITLNSGDPDVSHMYVAKYSASGTGIWASEASATSRYIYLGTLSLYDTDKLYAAGDFLEEATFGTSTLLTSATDKSNGYVTQLLPSSITTGSLSASIVCAGGILVVPYTTSGVFNPGNTFRVQLSNASGSFAAPVTLPTLSSTATSITARIPTNAAPGTNYRVRVVSTNPVIGGSDNGANLAIRSFTVTITTDPVPDFPGGPVSICAGGTVTLTAGSSSPTPLNYTWTPLPDLSPTTGSVVTFNPFDPGPYYITVSGTDGTCSKVSAPQLVDVLDGCFMASTSLASSPFKLFPNPAVQSFSVQLQESDEDVLIEVLDMQGNVRERRRGKAGTYTLTTETLGRGFYIVKVSLGKKIYRERVVIK